MFLGVDAGGSHVECGIGDQHSGILARKTYSPAPGAASNPRDLAELIISAGLELQTGLQVKIKRVLIGAAGAGNPEVRTSLKREIRRHWPALPVTVTTDIEIALESCFPADQGILIASGTGSFAVRRNADGTSTRVGGQGPSSGDEGSAYDLGKTALVKSKEDWYHSATMVEAFKIQLDGRTVTEMIEDGTPAEVAALARTVCNVALAGDQVAIGLVEDAAQELLSLAAELGIDGQQLPTVLGGGLLSPGSPVRANLVNWLRAASQHFVYTDTSVDPLLGAFSIASKQAD